MQYSVFFLSAIAATGAIAAPAVSTMSHDQTKPVPDMGIRVKLSGQNEVILTQKNFDSDVEISHTFKQKPQGPFDKVTLELGPKVKNQEVRCVLVDDQETPKPIILTRGPNIDINFSKGDPWAFKDGKASKVTKVTCGPKQLKTDQTTVKEIVVSLNRKAEPGTVVTQDISQTKFEEDKLPQEKTPEDTSENKMFNQVKLAVGFAIKNRALRCKVLDKDGKRIIVTRGKNIDFTFGDGDNPNVWTFANGPSEVSKIVCDPAFKKDDASSQVKKPMTTTDTNNGAPAPEDMEEGAMEPAAMEPAATN